MAFLVAFVILWAAPVFAQGAMTNGANHSGAISSAGDIDEWTFTVTAGDWISLSVGEQSTGPDPFFPWIRLIGPTGTQLDSAFGALVAQINHRATLNGTYTVRVASADSGNDATGTYQLTLAKNPGAHTPGDEGGPMTNGVNHQGALHLGDLDMWTFTATQNDWVSLAIGEVTSGADPFVPYFRLIGPTGVLLDSNWGALAALMNIRAPATGVYALIVTTADSGNDATGTYQLTMAKNPGAHTPGDDGGPLSNGANHSGSLHVGDLDMWTFEAMQNDWVSLALGEVTSGPDPLVPYFRLVGPDGALLDSAWNALAAQINIRAPQTGRYAVIVTTADSGNDATGTYQLTIAKSHAPHTPGDEGGTLSNGPNHSGTLHVGDLDMWTFAANQNDWVSLALGEVTSGADPLVPYFRLVAPSGALLDSSWNALAAQINIRAPQTGTYHVIVTTADSGNDATGTYLLTMAKNPGGHTPGDEGGPLSNGPNHAGTLHVGDLDMWTFTANQNDWVSLALGEVTSSADPLVPYFRLVGPDGALLDSSWNVLAAQINIRAPSTGTYAVIVTTADSGNDATGTYQLTMAKTHAPYAPGEEGGAIVNGANHAGTLHVGDLDMWMFEANANDAISLGLGEVTSGTDPLIPYFRLIGPNGALLDSSWNSSAAFINVTATLTGTYYVIVTTNDSGTDATGTYRLTLAKTPGTFVVPVDDDGGPMTPGTVHTGTIHVGDLDQWRFCAVPGSALNITMTQTGGASDFYPWMRLRNPVGTQIASDSGELLAQLNLAATVRGVHTLVLSTADSGNDAVGDYTIRVLGAQAITPFTEEALTGAVAVIKAVHINELRLRINALRASFGLPQVSWTDSALAGVVVKQVHIAELRTAVLAVFAAASVTPPTFTDTLVPQQTLIKAAHVMELRAAVLAIECGR